LKNKNNKKKDIHEIEGKFSSRFGTFFYNNLGVVKGRGEGKKD
jgi:hypothetical protein